MIKVLFCGLRHEYGKATSGTSFEYRNLYRSLETMPGVEASFFATDDGLDLNKREKLNNDLISVAQEQRPDLLFCFLFTNELKKETISFITKNTKTKTFNWFADDHWRFPIYSRFWAPLFTAVSTTDSQAVAKYKKIGIGIIKTQWASSITTHYPLPITHYKYDISFVGKNYGMRGKYIKCLKNAGMPAEGFGKGWDSGVVKDNQLLEIFTQSKINLNFTESYFNWLNQIAKLFITKEFGSYRPNFQHPISNIKSLIGARRAQIKSRIFEIPAQGGFLMTGDADNLKDYYQDEKEIVVFRNSSDLVEKCRYYLNHESQRQDIARAGYERTMRDHTYEKRFTEIFNKLGLW